MPNANIHNVDAVKELRLRRWARKNYVFAPQRSRTWHPVVLDEMYKRDAELAEMVEPLGIDQPNRSYVPLAPDPIRPHSIRPDSIHIVHDPHPAYGSPTHMHRTAPPVADRFRRTTAKAE